MHFSGDVGDAVPYNSGFSLVVMQKNPQTARSLWSFSVMYDARPHAAGSLTDLWDSLPAGAPGLLVLQQVADLGEQNLLGGGGGGSGLLGGGFGLLLLADLGHLVQTLHQEEDHQSQDGEVDDGGDEVAVVQGVEDLVAGLIQNGLAEEAGQDDLQLGEVDAAHEDGDDGHDDVVGQGLGDGGEGGADDGTDSQRHGVALHGKGHELIPPGGFQFAHNF